MKFTSTSVLKKIAAILLFFVFAKHSQAVCTANFTYAIGAGGNVTFTSTSIGTNSMTNFYWNFDDGNNVWNPGYPFASHSYSYNGVFNVTLNITDTAALCSSSVVITLTITNAPCTGSLSFTSVQNPSGLVNFSNSSTNLGPNANYSWAFGDGGTSNLNSPSHTYTLSGLYNVTLTATDQLAICSYSMVQSVSVTVASCSLTSAYTYTIGAGGNVNFTSTSTGTTGTTGYFWDFGDGTYGSGATTAHTYTSNGTYNAMLGVSDSVAFFCWDSIIHSINLNAPCFANVSFNMAKDSMALPAIVWNAYPSYPLNVTAADWSWGDGSNTLGLYPSHTYSAAGMYSICVSVTVSCGSTATACVNSNIFRTGNANTIAQVNVINNMPTGIKNSSQEQLKIALYPNPNNGEFEIKGSVQEKNAEIAIFNLFGQVVYRTLETNLNGSIDKKLNLSELANGTYFVKIASGKNSFNSKLIINK